MRKPILRRGYCRHYRARPALPSAARCEPPPVPEEAGAAPSDRELAELWSEDARLDLCRCGRALETHVELLTRVCDCCDLHGKAA